MESLQIIEFSSRDTELITQTTELRAFVWDKLIGRESFENGRWSDCHDDHAYHWGAVDTNSRLIASCRLCIHDKLDHFPDYDDIEGLLVDCPAPPIAMMSRLVVHPAYQRHGIAKRLVQIRIQKAISKNCKSIMCEVPFYRSPCYEALGFKHIGPAKDMSPIRETNIPFHLHIKSFPTTSAALLPKLRSQYAPLSHWIAQKA